LLGFAIVYVLRGTGERLSGAVQLSEDDRWTIPVKAPNPAAPGGSGVFNLLLAGDIDGDGSQEILTNLVPDDPTGSSPVYLVPSTPRAPD
jgi:hypothetical protein